VSVQARRRRPACRNATHVPHSDRTLRSQFWRSVAARRLLMWTPP